jgi:hypothetical protein
MQFSHLTLLFLVIATVALSAPVETPRTFLFGLPIEEEIERVARDAKRAEFLMSYEGN